MDYIPQIGDIIFKDSQKTGAKIVKYLMRSPSLWHDLYRMITNTLEVVEYYHPLMILLDDLAINQQWKVEYKNLEDAVNGNRVIIFRRKYLSQITKDKLMAVAINDIGQYWGVFHTLFGKFPTWLTYIPYFGRYLKLPNEEVSALRVARWYSEVLGENFGSIKYTDTNSHLMVKWMKSNPDLYEIVYQKD